jgi:hypothetical protein
MLKTGQAGMPRPVSPRPFWLGSAPTFSSVASRTIPYLCALAMWAFDVIFFVVKA